MYLIDIYGFRKWFVMCCNCLFIYVLDWYMMEMFFEMVVLEKDIFYV